MCKVIVSFLESFVSMRTRRFSSHKNRLHFLFKLVLCICLVINSLNPTIPDSHCRAEAYLPHPPTVRALNSGGSVTRTSPQLAAAVLLFGITPGAVSRISPTWSRFPFYLCPSREGVHLSLPWSTSRVFDR